MRVLSYSSVGNRRYTRETRSLGARCNAELDVAESSSFNADELRIRQRTYNQTLRL